MKYSNKVTDCTSSPGLSGTWVHRHSECEGFQQGPRNLFGAVLEKKGRGKGILSHPAYLGPGMALLPRD